MLPFIIGFFVIGGITWGVDTAAGILAKSDGLMNVGGGFIFLILMYYVGWQAVFENEYLAQHAVTIVQLQIPLFGFLAGSLVAMLLRYDMEIVGAIFVTIVVAVIAWFSIGFVALSAGDPGGDYGEVFVKTLETALPCDSCKYSSDYMNASTERFVTLTESPASWVAGFAAYFGTIAIGLLIPVRRQQN